MASLLLPASLLISIISALPLNSPLLPSYDYIIVGGGPSGLTVANRLSEDPNINVLVIEAGQADQAEPSVRSPFLAGQNIGSTYDWNLTTVPQTALDGTSRPISQGWVLGGGTVIGGLIYERPSRGDIDDWGWDDLEPFFKKAESYSRGLFRRQQQANPTAQDLDAFGYSGPVKVSYPMYAYKQSSSVMAGLNELGLPSMADMSSRDMSGAAILPLTVDPSSNDRSDARTAYLDPYLERPNLNVITSRMVTQVLLESVASNSSSAPSTFNSTLSSSTGTPLSTSVLNLRSASIGSWSWRTKRNARLSHTLPRQSLPLSGNRPSLRAVGVEIASNGSNLRRNITATREVIVAAGAVRTPQLMKLSGIGPRSELESLRLTVRIDLPGVGSNLQDHYLLSLTYPQRASRYSSSGISRNATNLTTLANLSIGPQEAIVLPPMIRASNRTTQRTTLAQTQNIAQFVANGTELSVITGFQAQRSLILTAMLSTSQSAWEIIGSNEGGWAIANRRMLSRGTVMLQSSSPFAAPIVDPRYGSNPIDLEILLDAVIFVNRLFMTSPFRNSNLTSSRSTMSATTAATVLQLIRQRVQTSYNLAGTAAMLPLNLGGVVDSQLLVYGTSNLRVVDASIMPLIPASNLQAVVYGVAEKAADLIKSARSGTSSINPPVATSINIGAPSALPIGSASGASSRGTAAVQAGISASGLVAAPGSAGSVAQSAALASRLSSSFSTSASIAGIASVTSSAPNGLSSTVPDQLTTASLPSGVTLASSGVQSAGILQSTISAVFGSTASAMVLVNPGISQPAASLTFSNTGMTRSTILGTFGTTGSSIVVINAPIARPTTPTSAASLIVGSTTIAALTQASTFVPQSAVPSISAGPPGASSNQGNASTFTASVSTSSLVDNLIIRTVPSGFQAINASSNGTSRVTMPVYVTTV
ncbi:Cellobiose dehydrogenase [Elsinoe australis]|uniref:Cellobiose dehydrogenase n=1 Tax=Elsinoe australis TaxID=40998 RepID=A0A2P8AFS2_9PEZI|nr:Cellobiose dehydrogenase [Elsinoe australis]